MNEFCSFIAFSLPCSGSTQYIRQQNFTRPSLLNTDSVLPYRYCGFVCVYVCTIIMSIFKVAMCRFIIFGQEHMDIKTYGHAVGVVRIALGDTVAYDTI